MHATTFFAALLLAASGIATAAPGGTAGTASSALLLPFPVDPSTMAHLRGTIGQRCDLLFSPQPDLWTGFAPIRGFAPVATPGGTVHPMMKDQSRFAFLVTGSGEGCLIRDVVVLPDPQTANVFEECHASGSTSADGFAMRAMGEKTLVAWWTVDPQSHRFVRQRPESREKLRCREPDGDE
jgi:hypothetical protein